MSDTNEIVTNTNDLTKFLATARERFARAVLEEASIRKEAKIDLEFVAGKQWSDRTKIERDEANRPALTFNKLPTFVQSVANEARQNKPQAKVNPVSGGACADTAKVINGILRHVQYRSKADVAYDTALEYAAAGSFGFFRFTTEYGDDDSFEQEILIKPVLDPFSVYGVLIPSAMGKRCDWAFVIERMTKEEFKKKYPNAEATSRNFSGEAYDDAGVWFGDNDVQVAEYWYDETKPVKIRQLSDGRIVKASDPVPEGVEVITERDVMRHTIKQCITNGLEILECTDWVGKDIPIVAVLGKQMIVDGKINLFSLVRFLRDPQQLFNFYKSGIAEKIGLNNRVPYIGYEGQFTDPKWLDANVRNYAYLEAKGVMIGGTLAPLPQRQQLEEQIQALSIAAAAESDDMKAIAGVFDASLGAEGNETSGIGIARRQQQSSITNLHFSDNLNRAEWAGCLIMLDLIPQIYNEPGRQVRIIGEDESQSVVKVNQAYQNEAGQTKHYALDAGKYDVVVTTGPSFTTARQEGADTLGQVFKAAPESFQILGDLWIGSMDYTWSEEAAKRLKSMLPPQVQQSEDDGAQKIPPQVQQHLQQLSQQHEQLVATVHQLTTEIEMKKAELDSRERIATMQEETKRTIALATLNQSVGVTMLENELALVHKKLDLMHKANMQDAQQAHEQSQMQAQHDQAAALQGAQQGHEADQAAQAQDAAAQSQQSAQDAAQQQADMPKAA